MSNLQEIECAVSRLSPEALANFRALFAEISCNDVESTV